MPRIERSLTPRPRKGPDPSGPQPWLLRQIDRVSKAIWREDRPRRGPKGLAHRALRVAYLAIQGFTRDDCVLRASALTYITVLSIVPLLAFSFSVAKGFGFYRQLVEKVVNPFLDRTFGPLAEAAPLIAPPGAPNEIRVALARILELVGSVVEDTEVTSLGAFGLVILCWAVLKLLGNIERAFNHIWGVQRPRSFVRKVSDYLAMVVVTPILMFTATGITAAAQGVGLVEVLRESLHLGPLIDLAVALVPLLSLWLGFTFLYLAMPNARTRIPSAIVGALVGGTLWQITLLLHLKFQIGVARYSAIYSSFAAIPIFLIWVQISWLTVLLGAEVCFAHQTEPSCVRIEEARPADHAFKELIGLRAMARIGESFLSGAEPWTVDRLAVEMHVPSRPLQEVLDTLVEQKLLMPSPAGKEEAFLPARDLEAITVKSVIDALKGTTGPVDVPARAGVDVRIDHILESLDSEVSGSRSNATILSLARAIREEEERAAAAEEEEASEGRGEVRAAGRREPLAKRPT